MAGKFHVNNAGRVMPCSAQSGNCPFGGDDQHFDNFEEAQLAADKKNELLTKGNDDLSSSKTQEEKKMKKRLEIASKRFKEMENRKERFLEKYRNTGDRLFLELADDEQRQMNELMEAILEAKQEVVGK